MTNRTRWRDANGGEWVCFISLEKARKLKDERGVDLLDPESLKSAFADVMLVAEIIADLHVEQWHGKMELYAFAELAMATPEVSLSSSAALEAALADFFLRVRRPAMAAVVEKAREAEDALQAAQIATLNGPATQAAIDRLVAESVAAAKKRLDEIAIHGDASGKPPAS